MTVVSQADRLGDTAVNSANATARHNAVNRIARDAKGNATALVVTKDNKVERRTVTAAQAIGDKWLITAGLKAGDRLIVEGTDKVQPDATIKPVPVASAQ